MFVPVSESAVVGELGLGSRPESTKVSPAFCVPYEPMKHVLS